MMIPLLLVALAQGPTLTLEDALAAAKQNPRTAQARNAALQAGRRVDEARAGFLPSASATASAGISRGAALSSSITGEPTSLVQPFYSAGVNANQLLWDFGRADANVGAADAQRRAAEADVGSQEAAIALSVRTSYLAVLAAEALAASSEANVAAQARHVALAEAQVEVGRRPPYDVTRAKIDLGNARLARVQAQNAVLLARADLSYAIGEDIAARALVEPPTPTTTDPEAAAALEEALRSRPELATIAARLLAQAASVTAASKAGYPTIAANGQASLRGAASLPTLNWQVGANLSVPLTNGGADAARLGQQEAALDALEDSRAALVLDLKLEVERQLVAVGQAKESVSLSAEVVKQAGEGVHLAEGRYEAGAGTIVELTDAQVQLTVAQTNEIRARLDLATARARLDRALGRR